MEREFRIARMDLLFWILTPTIVLPVAVVFWLVGVVPARQGPLQWLPLATAAFILAIVLVTWLWYRPTRFVVGPSTLTIVWPLRARELARPGITDARIVDVRTLRDILGTGMRIGVGGLFGQFGWVWSTKRGLVDCYITRVRGIVWVERGEERPLMITPEDPEGFVRAVTGRW